MRLTITAAILLTVATAHAQEMAALPPAAALPLPKVRAMPAAAIIIPHSVPLAPWQDALPGRFPKRLHAPPQQWRDDNVPPTAFLRLQGWGTQRWLQDEMIMRRLQQRR